MKSYNDNHTIKLFKKPPKQITREDVDEMNK